MILYQVREIGKHKTQTSRQLSKKHWHTLYVLIATILKKKNVWCRRRPEYKNEVPYYIHFKL